ncbi:DNA-binding response regulator, NarL/FixJ family, contains REC and HTH domains [Ulvibacter litoralis]|uniref:DNA-binding response regulator, NarL/FixJ family, contains REC and HTH domains n=2 Tax=Ulvibacter litoralis TaxID=227084 RepID=A0A1G7GJB6_9FLAO|nr:response regulator transcription factor [Ulvibacter litoralis]GHC55989.1 DNA-binding response regulator [Ulvibacter litoralis]SDE88109.1 DNA-binding response regulator, NarL/FixJ family, contains REC and HTH domains [Ulvibacter litoralis]
MEYSVVVVDDHILLSQAIGGLVEAFDQFKVMYLCKNGQELIDALQNPKNIPDIVLMDVNMPILNGIETTAHLKDHFPEVKVLALSIEEDDATILKMLRAGAKGYLMKDVKKAELQEALLEVVENGYYHTNTVAKILVNSLRHKESSVLSLKEREIEFIQHACTEKTYREIADIMCLSPKTIEGYRDVLFEKLNLRNRTGLVIYAIKNKIFTP